MTESVSLARALSLFARALFLTLSLSVSSVFIAFSLSTGLSIGLCAYRYRSLFPSRCLAALSYKKKKILSHPLMPGGPVSMH